MSIPSNVTRNPLNTNLPVTDPESMEVNSLKEVVNRGELPPQITTSKKPGDSETNLAPPLPPPMKTSIEDMILALTALNSKLQETRQQTSVTEIKGNMTKQTQENNDRLQKINESVEKMEKSKKSGTFGKVFGWIASIAAVIAAVALIATGVGAVVGGLLLAGALIGLANQILQEIPAVNQWMQKNPAVGWVILGVQIALAIATVGVGVAGALKAAADTSIKVAAQFVQKLATVIQGASAIGAGASGIATGVYQKDASDATAKAKEIEAGLQKLQGMLDEEMARLKKMLEEAQEGFSIAMNIMNSTTQTKQTMISRQAV